MTVLHLDYETYSRVDLIKRGAYVYAADRSTGIHCLGWAFDDDEPQIWTPFVQEDGEEFTTLQLLPTEVFTFMSKGEHRSLHAHNAQFERLITEHVLRPHLQKQGLDFRIPVDAWYCTAAQARARALPAALDDLGRALELPLKKDRRGRDLIRMLCVPRLGRAVNFDEGEFLWETDPGEAVELLAELYDYCLTDVIVERAAAQCSGPLTDMEFDDYVVNELINDRGIAVDLAFAHAAQQYAAEEVAEISEELSRVTNGQVTTPKQYKRQKEWLAPYMEDNDRLRRAMTIYKTDRQTGETHKKISLDRNVRETLLAIGEEMPGEIPEHVLDFVDLVDEAGRSSVSKYKAMELRASEDGKVRGAYLYAGAGQTKRFSSKGLQVHNMRRASRDDFDEIRATVISGEPLPPGEVMDTLASCMRQTLVAPGHNWDEPDYEAASDDRELVWGDWSAIEAIVLPWLAKSPKAQPLLDKFEAGIDVYKGVAASIYGGSEDDIGDESEERQIGKVAQLSLGYQGALKALQSMARNYGIVIEDQFGIRVVGKWRAANPWATKFWAQLERAAKNAVNSPGEVFTAGRISYVFDHEIETLYARLPNGEYLSYPKARLEAGDDGRWRLSSLKAQWKPAADSDDEWPRVDLYGGLLAENATQATAACVLRAGLFELEELEWEVIGHTHDEIVVEVYTDEVVDMVKTMRWLMHKRPDWAPDMPLSGSVKHGRRYRK